jgi:hypothetical protein
MPARADVEPRTDPIAPPTPASYGIGARLSIYPMTEGFVDVILGALTDAPRAPGLEVATDDVSTFVRGNEADVAEFVRDVVARAADERHHLGGHVMFSRGCPGEVSCGAELGGRPWAPSSLPPLAPTGHHAAGHWSLYPLLDATGDPDPDLAADHMSVIEDAIRQAELDGTLAGGGHFVTRLEGDVADVLGTVVRTWITAGARVQHVVAHLTFSINSPTAPAGARETR